MDKIIRHITLTGQHAGTTWCGVSRYDGPDNERILYHHLGSWIDNPDLYAELCPDCRAMYEESDNEEE